MRRVLSPGKAKTPPSSPGEEASSPEDAARALAEAKSRSADLTAQVAALTQQLELATGAGSGFKCGTLYKYRPWAEGVFKDPWSKRFIQLVGHSVLSFRDSNDARRHTPRSSVTLEPGCTIKLEGCVRSNTESRPPKADGS
jgi:hypothetical protein